ncbi:MAG: hypothetical protein LBS88_01040 [Tannerellaceae bacterium]|jgi:hypothetical protein|nr:hypothetical protein [Tannerellaceae bacterium]
MKPLIVTFFAFLLCYSLLTQNNETKSKPVLMNKQTPSFDEIKHHETKKSQSADSILYINYLIT